MEGERVSKPRYKWWGYVKGMIRDYPALKERYAELHSTSMVADYSGMPRGAQGRVRGQGAGECGPAGAAIHQPAGV